MAENPQGSKIWWHLTRPSEVYAPGPSFVETALYSFHSSSSIKIQRSSQSSGEAGDVSIIWDCNWSISFSTKWWIQFSHALSFSSNIKIKWTCTWKSKSQSSRFHRHFNTCVHRMDFIHTHPYVYIKYINMKCIIYDSEHISFVVRGSIAVAIILIVNIILMVAVNINYIYVSHKSNGRFASINIRLHTTLDQRPALRAVEDNFPCASTFWPLFEIFKFYWLLKEADFFEFLKCNSRTLELGRYVDFLFAVKIPR